MGETLRYTDSKSICWMQTKGKKPTERVCREEGREPSFCNSKRLSITGQCLSENSTSKPPPEAQFQPPPPSKATANDVLVPVGLSPWRAASIIIPITHRLKPHWSPVIRFSRGRPPERLKIVGISHLASQGGFWVTCQGALSQVTFPPLLYSFVAKIGLRKGRPADFSGHSPRALSFAAADTRTQPMRGKAVNWVHTSPSIYERCRQSTQPGARELLLVLLNFYTYCWNSHFYETLKWAGQLHLLPGHSDRFQGHLLPPTGAYTHILMAIPIYAEAHSYILNTPNTYMFPCFCLLGSLVPISLLTPAIDCLQWSHSTQLLKCYAHHHPDSQTEMPKAGASLQLSLVDLALGGELPICSTRPADPGGLGHEWFHSGLLTQQSLRHSGPGNEGIEDNAIGK